MQQLELTAEEVEILHHILQQEVQDLDLEVHRTDSLSYKGMLKERKHVLVALADKVAALDVMTPH